MEKPIRQTHRIKELDALRGIAALMVVFFHFSKGKSFPYGLNYIRLGNTGVELFFMISGFVIFMSFEYIIKSSQFIINRFIRLFPTYWTVVTFTFLLTITLAFYRNVRHIDFKVYIGNMTMFQHYLGMLNLDESYWTMIVEMNFYVLMVLLFQFRLLKFVADIGVFICALMLFLLACNMSIVNQLIFWIPLLTYSPLFFSGIVFFKIKSDNGSKTLNYFIIVFLLVCQLVNYSIINRKVFLSHIEYAVMLIIYFSLFLLFVNGWLHFIVSKITLFFGKISYALYLSHAYLSNIFLIPILMITFHFRFIFASLTALTVSVLIATLITFFVEIPIRKLFKKYIYSK